MWTKTKYGNKRTESCGISFASQLEAALYDHLKLLETGGVIKDISCQVNVHLTDAKILMIPDFSAFDIDLNEKVFYEAKGIETDVWRIKRRLWKHYGPGRLSVYKGTARSLKCVETIIPSGMIKT